MANSLVTFIFFPDQSRYVLFSVARSRLIKLGSRSRDGMKVYGSRRSKIRPMLLNAADVGDARRATTGDDVRLSSCLSAADVL